MKKKVIEDIEFEEVNKNQRVIRVKKLPKKENNQVEAVEKIPKTKLEAILFKKNIVQGDLRRMIYLNSGYLIGRDRISKICTGKTKTYNLKTAVLIAEALEVKVDDILEIKNVKKAKK